jgi:hypothetical protein
VIDSKSVKMTESEGLWDYDAGKRAKARKRHIVVDTLALMVGVMVHSADIEYRDGAPDLLKSTRPLKLPDVSKHHCREATTGFWVSLTSLQAIKSKICNII